MAFKQVFLLCVWSMVFVFAEDAEGIIELIIKDGYSVEDHYVVTSDGYILEMHRISKHNGNCNNNNNKVVFVMHDLLCSSADFVVTGPDHALAYYLADNNYDVWLGNARGNNYSRHHLTLDPEPYNSTFWDFDWHEIGVYDLPAMIDHILNATGEKQLYYIGHSQGATAFFVMASMLPEYNAKISGMSALSPLAFVGNPPSTFLKDLSIYNIEAPGVEEFLMNTEYPLSYCLFCNPNNYSDCLNAMIPETNGMCHNIYFLLIGYSTANIDLSRLNMILKYNPSGVSSNSLFHYAQCIESENFAEFRPGNVTGPDYNLTQITTKITLFHSSNDIVISDTDVQILKDRLINSNVTLYKIENDHFSHSDFVYANNAIDLVYKYILNEMKNL